MPELVRNYPEREDFMQAFCRYADDITDETTEADDAWADDAWTHEALDSMLTRYCTLR